jgi:hypothetical protein
LINRLAIGALLAGSATAADPAPVLTAKDLADQLGALQQDGSSYVRLTLEVKPPPGTPKTVLQLQIKQRRTATATEVVYQVMWPKERAGEAVLLRQIASQPASGALFTPPNSLRALAAAQLKEPLFGGDLSYADVLENFFGWQHQAVVGTEVVDRVNCQILESKPGTGQHSGYARVRTWVDLRRMVPLRVEKYLPSGALARRIATTRVVTDDRQRQVPANLTVSGARTGSTTELDGSRLTHGVSYGEGVFTPAGLQDMSTPRSGSD